MAQGGKKGHMGDGLPGSSSPQWLPGCQTTQVLGRSNSKSPTRCYHVWLLDPMH